MLLNYISTLTAEGAVFLFMVELVLALSLGCT